MAKKMAMKKKAAPAPKMSKGMMPKGMMKHEMSEMKKKGGKC